jgi:hypothetical protein
VTHEQTIELLLTDVKNLAPELVAAVTQAKNLHVLLRDLPGGDFCWAVMELQPGDKRRAVWTKEIPFEALPGVVAHFRANKAFDNYLRERAMRARKYLNQVRAKLGIEMTIEEAMR